MTGAYTIIVPRGTEHCPLALTDEEHRGVFCETR